MSVARAFVAAVLKLSVFTLFILIGGSRLVPRLLNKIADTHSRELFTLSVLAVALGIAAAATFLFDVSMALGAFLAGMVVGQSDFSARAAAEALPMRDAFAVMFFLSVGMLLDPSQLLDSPLLTLATLVIVMIGKPLAAFAIVTMLGYGSRIGLGVAIALAQIGEFSFLVATLGRQVGVLPEAALNPLVASAIVSIMLNPALYRTVGPVEGFLERRPRLWRLLNPRRPQPSGLPVTSTAPKDAAHRAIVVGHGPIGQTVVRLLSDRGIEPTIIEMNIETYRNLRSQGRRAVYGDANRSEVLEEAGVRAAGFLILTASGSSSAVEAIRTARELNPRIHVAARADFLRQTEFMKKAGAAEVFSGEGEVALAITDSILRQLGSTPEQLDEERNRIRTDLFHRGPS
jgi:CPA2 family monovalent cation:H+ antiporter-2